MCPIQVYRIIQGSNTLLSNTHGTAFYRIRLVWCEFLCLCPTCALLLLQALCSTRSQRAPGRSRGSRARLGLSLSWQGSSWAGPSLTTPQKHPQSPWLFQIQHLCWAHTRRARRPSPQEAHSVLGREFNKAHKQLWQCNQKGHTALVFLLSREQQLMRRKEFSRANR